MGTLISIAKGLVLEYVISLGVTKGTPKKNFSLNVWFSHSTKARNHLLQNYTLLGTFRLGIFFYKLVSTEGLVPNPPPLPPKPTLKHFVKLPGPTNPCPPLVLKKNWG